MNKIGLIVNPIAGMGGSVGLKGTDGDIFYKALKMGATPIASQKLNQFLSSIKNKNILFITSAPGKMGADYLKNFTIPYEILGEIGDSTSAKDTKRIVRQMVENRIELLIFSGGDGTARDIYDAIGLQKSVIAIPSGVKMLSPVFALNPRAAAQIIDRFLENFTETVEREVLDIDEDLVRKGILKSKLYGYLKVPKILNLIQSGKTSRMGGLEEENKREIAQFLVDFMEDDTLYLLGPGTTIKAITDNLKLPKTLLGVDAIYNRQNIGTDLNEQGILNLLSKYENKKIIITPIGGQGFIFGRGNKQITPKILKLVGGKNILIIASKGKINELDCLRVDSGDIEADYLFKGLKRVIIGYKEERIVQIKV
ncbi:hypothetical protein LCGC14_0632450 [marine sediment metagenome]|uniref:ATP-NAD kinase n=1 Tax=marine sediment metagenome TaxID=412755 RepID=A0A0F9RL05_9ZZZZ